MKPIPPESYFEVIVPRNDTEEDKEFFIGLIHDLDLSFIDQFSQPREIDNLIDSLGIYNMDWPQDSVWVIFKVHKFSWDEGEQTDPASGLWEQLPGWEYEVELLRHEFMCNGCGNSIDPDNCGCGGPIKGHVYENHPAIPHGCTCHTHQPDSKFQFLAP